MQAVERTLLLLSAIASRPAQPISITELSEATGLSVSTVHRYSSALVDLGYLRRDAEKRFSLAARGIALGTAASDPDAIATRVRNCLRDLRAATGETSFASQLAGHDVVCIAMERGTKPLQLTVRVGQTIPPIHAASARAVLAFVSEDAVADAFANAPDSEDESLTDFSNRLAEVRQRGFDICNSEFDEGVWAVAAPVRSSRTGELFGAITVAGPAAAFSSAESRAEVTDLVLAATTEVSSLS